MNAPSCPDEYELLTLATGDTAGPEVGVHVDRCEDCRKRLARLQVELANLRAAAGELQASSAPGNSAPPGTTLPPTLNVGKYVVLDHLGRGGQADVYRALHPTLGREVVIKLARRSLRPDEANRLLAEGKILSELDHPHLARVYDLDFDSGRPFLVMEYVRGRTLREHAEERRRTPREAARLVAQLAYAVGVAHRRGVVHQDLKPRNVLIDESGQPRLIDFGMARLVHGWVDSESQPGGGTRAYMAPEQARGETDRIGPRSDIFALGGVLYFLLMGRAPFQGNNAGEEWKKAQRGEVDRQALVAAKVPHGLQVVCLRALAPEPADRYASAEDLAADLMWFVHRPRRMAILASVAAAALLSWPSWKTWEWFRAQDRTSFSTQQEVRLPADALSLRLRRAGKPRELSSAAALAHVVPLRPGDELKINVSVPVGLHASLFLIGSDGIVQHLADAAPGELLSYPPDPGMFAPLDERPGTEVLLACWRRAGPVSLEEVQRLWDAGKPWPPLPDTSVLRIDHDRIVAEGRGRPLGPPTPGEDPEGEVRARLEALRLSLDGRVDFLSGVAFPHRR